MPLGSESESLWSGDGGLDRASLSELKKGPAVSRAFRGSESSSSCGLRVYQVIDGGCEGVVVEAEE